MINIEVYVDPALDQANLLIEDVEPISDNGMHLLKCTLSSERSNTIENIESLLSIQIFLLPQPKFYSPTFTDKDNIPLKKIALLHGDETLATTVNQRCKYWRGGTECKFCTIEHSLTSGATIEDKTGEQIIAVIKAARQENLAFAKHTTLTIGTQSGADKGMAHYHEIIKVLREEYPTKKDLAIHIQIEPLTKPSEFSYYKKVHDAGANTVGIHLEIMNDTLRAEFCPGKSLITRDQYDENWKIALKEFGPNQVDSFILVGLEKDEVQMKSNIDRIIAVGVIPLITPIRSSAILGLEFPKTNPNKLLDILLFAARACIRYNVDPLENQAGCIRCGGCSPILDAYRLETSKK